MTPGLQTTNELRGLLPFLTPHERAEMDLLLKGTQTKPPPTLAEFVEATAAFTLDPWQHLVCERLQRLRHERGQRILIHAPPQYGKSILVSQRFPAWMLGCNPTLRVKLACYNITHATRFGKIVKELMQGREYERIFPDGAARIPKIASAEEFSTRAQSALQDAQPSFKALGLATGFVGQGADLLIIDDPYASPQDAYSDTIRNSVWTFWNDSAKVRLNDDTNVVVMFHRYVEDDLAGKLWAQGGWEMLRFAAIADGDPELPDPTLAAGLRQVGEKLSPRVSDAFLAEQQKSPAVWFGQFQGRPLPPGGGMFQTEKFRIVRAAPIQAVRVRYWDKAGTEGGGAYSVGVLMARAYDTATRTWGGFYVEDVVREQFSAARREPLIKQTAQLDARRYGIGRVDTWLEQEPGSGGKESAENTVRNTLAGFVAKHETVTGDKEFRARPYADQVGANNVFLVEGDWNAAYIKEHGSFPLGTYKDQVDASSGAFNKLVLIRIPGAPVAGGKRQDVADAARGLRTGIR